MTPEQFVCWLQGYLKGLKHGNQKLAVSETLEEQLKVVELPIVKYEVVE